MAQVALLTTTQKNKLVGQYYSADNKFNPIQDIDTKWVISVEELEYCTNNEFMWVKSLTLVEYQEKPRRNLFVK